MNLMDFSTQSNLNKEMIFNDQASIEEMEEKFLYMQESCDTMLFYGSDETIQPKNHSVFPDSDTLPLNSYSYKWNLRYLCECDFFMQRFDPNLNLKHFYPSINYGSFFYSRSWRIVTDALYKLDYLHYGEPKIW